VEIRIKHKARDPMHLKTYQIDGKLPAHRRPRTFPHPGSSARIMI
jgi:hypothetical protein